MLVPYSCIPRVIHASFHGRLGGQNHEPKSSMLSWHFFGALGDQIVLTKKKKKKKMDEAIVR